MYDTSISDSMALWKYEKLEWHPKLKLIDLEVMNSYKSDFEKRKLVFWGCVSLTFAGLLFKSNIMPFLSRNSVASSICLVSFSYGYAYFLRYYYRYKLET